MTTLTDFIINLPKVELHCHIEGTLEPELMFAIGQRNGIELPFASIEEARAAYNFSDLQSFLDIYDYGTNVLRHEQDFYDMTYAYLEKAHAQHMQHVEIFFDPQTHTERGTAFATVIKGIHRALCDGEKNFGISFKIIMGILRHMSVESGLQTLDEALAFKDLIIGIGINSTEKGNPPEKYLPIFDKAREHGFLTVAHAGEEGPADYIWQAIKLLHVKRVDHGVRCTEDARLMAYLKEHQIPLTVCPLSNTALRVFPDMQQHNIKQLMDYGLCVTVNSDDPAYFGGYITENYLAIAKAFGLTQNEIVQLAKNAINATFLDDNEQAKLTNALRDYSQNSSS